MRKLLIISGLCAAVAIAVSGLLSFEKAGAITPVKFMVPEGFPHPQYNFSTNPLTREGIELGRRLFYDGRLSKDGNFACAACHQQFAGFASFDHDLSHGFNDQFTTRNAPVLLNLAWQKEFHHDGGINNLEVQPLAPMLAGNEMGEKLDSVIAKLKKDPQYKMQFKAAFGSTVINSQRMLKALTQFMLTLISADSKYDRVRAGKEQFNAYEQAGYTVFKARCASCHAEPLFTDLSYRNNGLAVSPYLKDIGRMKISGRSEDSLKFKVPSLRNVASSAPYMHDGRIYGLTDAVKHYRDKIIQSPTLDSSLRNGIAMSNADVVNVVAFLRTLTDSTFLKNPSYAPPAGMKVMGQPMDR